MDWVFVYVWLFVNGLVLGRRRKKLERNSCSNESVDLETRVDYMQNYSAINKLGTRVKLWRGIIFYLK